MDGEERKNFREVVVYIFQGARKFLKPKRMDIKIQNLEWKYDTGVFGIKY